MNALQSLNALGQSIWYDNITRSMLNGDLEKLIERDDLRGITSNPSIFQKAITQSDDYDSAISSIVKEQPDISAKAMFFELAIPDIQGAADQLKGQYDKTNGTDGFVSLEVSPDLANDTEGTIAEAKTLHERVNCPNVMIKVPATLAGIPAIETLIAEGISINVTLLFSVERYEAVAHAYINGIQKRLDAGLPIEHIRSVASFFVSRVDAAVDPLLEDKEDGAALKGKIAIANAKAAYQSYLKIFDTEAFRALGAAPQRLLWASTSTKDPDYPDTLYMDTLIGENTVNTVPPATYNAYLDHGEPRLTLHENLDEANAQLEKLSTLGIDLNQITHDLEVDGVASFAKAFDSLLSDLSEEIKRLS